MRRHHSFFVVVAAQCVLSLFFLISTAFLYSLSFLLISLKREREIQRERERGAREILRVIARYTKRSFCALLRSAQKHRRLVVLLLLSFFK